MYYFSSLKFGSCKSYINCCLLNALAMRQRNSWASNSMVSRIFLACNFTLLGLFPTAKLLLKTKMLVALRCLKHLRHQSRINHGHITLLIARMPLIKLFSWYGSLIFIPFVFVRALCCSNKSSEPLISSLFMKPIL